MDNLHVTAALTDFWPAWASDYKNFAEFATENERAQLVLWARQYSQAAKTMAQMERQTQETLNEIENRSL